MLYYLFELDIGDALTLFLFPQLGSDQPQGIIKYTGTCLTPNLYLFRISPDGLFCSIDRNFCVATLADRQVSRVQLKLCPFPRLCKICTMDANGQSTTLCSSGSRSVRSSLAMMILWVLLRAVAVHPPIVATQKMGWGRKDFGKGEISGQGTFSIFVGLI